MSELRDRRGESERGATLVEYALGVALVVVVSLGVITAMTDNGKSQLSSRQNSAGNPSESIGVLPGGPGGGGGGGSTTGGSGSTVSATIGPSNMTGSASDDSTNDKKWIAQVTIRVDSPDGPLAGATVKGSWGSGASAASECTTDVAGACVVQRTNLNDNQATATFTVNDVVSGDPLITIDYTGPDAHTVTCGSACVPA